MIMKLREEVRAQGGYRASGEKILVSPTFFHAQEKFGSDMAN
jgi:hypothetical protein